MTTPTHVFVTVPEGRLVPVPRSEASAAGGGLLKAAPAKLYALPWTTFTRRRIAAGDFVLVDRDMKPVKSPSAAAAPTDIKLAPDGTVDADQRSDEELAKESVAKASRLARGTFDTSETGKER